MVSQQALNKVQTSVQVDSARAATLFVAGGDYAQAARHRGAILRAEPGFGFRMGKPHRVVELGTPKAEAYVVIKPRDLQ